MTHRGIDPSAHLDGCRFKKSATCAATIECEHGYDVCPECDPCTCDEKQQPRGGTSMSDIINELSKLNGGTISLSKELMDQIERDTVDAERWRALMKSQRMHWMGSAGFDFAETNGRTLDDIKEITPRAGTYQHFGMEFWTHYRGDYKSDPNDRFCRRLLTTYVDHIRSKK